MHVNNLNKLSASATYVMHVKNWNRMQNAAVLVNMDVVYMKIDYVLLSHVRNNGMQSMTYWYQCFTFARN